jgi:signal peptidase I
MAATTGTPAPSRTTSDAAGRGAPVTLRTVLVGDNPRRTLARVAILLLASYIVFAHLLLPVRGQGPSMLPTLRDGQLVFVNTLAYARSEPSRGDIVAISLAGRRAMYIKRIVGLPGERVRIEGGTVIVNGAPLSEPYVERRSPWNTGEATLGRDEFLVIGDNRGMPAESHDFGRAPRERVIGRVVSW